MTPESAVCAPSIARVETAEEPLHPGRDVHRALLRPLEDAVVVAALLANLRRHAVEALRAAFRSRQRHVGDRARDAAVAIVERVNRHEPEMRQRGLQHGLGGRVAVEPVEEPAHLVVEPIGRRRLEVHALATDRTRHDLHGRRAVVTPRADRDALHAAPRRSGRATHASRRAARRSAAGRSCCVASSIISTTPSTWRSAGFRPPTSMPSRRATDERTWSASSLSPFDLAALQHVVGERAKHRLFSDAEAQRFHLSEQASLQMPGGRQAAAHARPSFQRNRGQSGSSWI